MGRSKAGLKKKPLLVHSPLCPIPSLQGGDRGGGWGEDRIPPSPSSGMSQKRVGGGKEEGIPPLRPWRRAEGGVHHAVRGRGRQPGAAVRGDEHGLPLEAPGPNPLSPPAVLEHQGTKEASVWRRGPSGGVYDEAI